jgi:PKD repeat protein
MSAIRVVDGDGQNGEVGQVLSAPLVVEVTDASGQPMVDATVEFEFIAAGDGGAISPASTTTDNLGRAETYLQLGDMIGVQTGQAHLMVDGASAFKTSFTAIASPATSPENLSPNAGFNWHCEDLTCRFSDTSSDPDGDVIGWSWQFGDENGADVAEPVHAYTAPGTYTVRLIVTDDDGASDQTSTEVEVAASPPPPENIPPQAEFEIHCHDQFCSFSDRSDDNDGNLVSWHWDFGDGTGSDASNPVHFYRKEGHYDVTLTVTDNAGGTNSKTHEVKIKD